MDGSSAQASVFILSVCDRDRLTALASGLGCHAVGARRLDDLEERLQVLKPEIVIVDAGGDTRRAIVGVRRTADAIGAREAAIVVLLPAFDGALAAEFLEAGATAYHAGLVDGPTLAAVLGFARRQLRHGSAGGPDARRAIAWRWRRGERGVTVETAVAARLHLGSGGTMSARSALRRLDRVARRGLLRALRQVGQTGSAAFAHRLGDGDERIVHHLREREGEVLAAIESIGGGLGEEPGATVIPARRARDAIADYLAARPTTLAVIGLSRLDAINGALGEQAGDALLRAAAQRIAAAAGAVPHAMAARLPGADFAICRPLVGADEALAFGRAVADAVGRAVVGGEGLIATPAHVGIASSEEAGADAKALLARATAALAQARAGDGPRVRVAGDAAAEQADASLDVDLRRALTEGQIEILFQPQVDIAEARIVGVEALARWRHPTRGEIDAPTLFAVATRSDYREQLSAHVHQRALKDAAGWPPQLAGLRIALNVTAADLARTDFAAELRGATREAGLPPSRITLEVTEETLIDDLGEAAERLAALRAAGYRTAIDDFGTGFSSLAYLKALPLDYLKIDRQLIGDMTGQPRDRIVVLSAIELARSLGLTVIAEGVERPEQLDLLAGAGCNLYQGFLCSAPVDSAALRRLVG